MVRIHKKKRRERRAITINNKYYINQDYICIYNWVIYGCIIMYEFMLNDLRLFEYVQEHVFCMKFHANLQGWRGSPTVQVL